MLGKGQEKLKQEFIIQILEKGLPNGISANNFTCIFMKDVDIFSKNDWNPNNTLVKTQWLILSFWSLFLKEIPSIEFLLHFKMFQGLPWWCSG